MNLLEQESLSFVQMQEILGGIYSHGGDFVVCKNHTWDRPLVGLVYKIEPTAIVLCMEGEVDISVNMSRLHMKPGTVLMCARESVVEMHSKSEHCVIDIMFFTNAFMHEAIIDLKAMLPIFQYISENEEKLLCLDEQEMSLVKKFYEIIYECLSLGKPAIIHDLMTAFIRTLGEIYATRVVGAMDPRGRHEEYVERFIELIGLHYKEERSVQFYAEAMYITPKYLSTVIKDVSGRSATEWINSFVIQEAKLMLRFSGKSIQEITYSLNFSTQSFFGKYFKRNTGMSPSEYRVKHAIE